MLTTLTTLVSLRRLLDRHDIAPILVLQVPHLHIASGGGDPGDKLFAITPKFRYRLGQPHV